MKCGKMQELWKVGNICDPLWENLPIRTDNFFSDLLINTAYLSYGASFDATLAMVLTI